MPRAPKRRRAREMGAGIYLKIEFGSCSERARPSERNPAIGRGAPARRRDGRGGRELASGRRCARVRRSSCRRSDCAPRASRARAVAGRQSARIGGDLRASGGRTKLATGEALKADLVVGADGSGQRRGTVSGCWLAATACPKAPSAPRAAPRRRTRRPDHRAVVGRLPAWASCLAVDGPVTGHDGPAVTRGRASCLSIANSGPSAFRRNRT